MSKSLTESKKFHTDAIYRCRITSCERKNFYLMRQCAIMKNNGDKKTLFIPKNELFLKRDMVEDKLQVGDYVSIKLEIDGRRTNITEVLNIDKIQRIEKKVEKNNKDNKKEDLKEKKNPNVFAALMNSDSDSDSDEEDK